jgi:hypothetical protein
MRNSFITAAMAAVFVLSPPTPVMPKSTTRAPPPTAVLKKAGRSVQRKSPQHSGPYSYNALRAAERYRGRWHNKVT